MAVLRLFAAAREAAGLTTDHIGGPTVGEVVDEACRRYGDRFAAVLGTSRIWVNGEPADRSTAVAASDVVAVLPPVSGGAQPGRDGPPDPEATVAHVPLGAPPARSPAGPGLRQPPDPAATAAHSPFRAPAGAAAPPMSRPPGPAPAAAVAVAGSPAGEATKATPMVRGNLALVADPAPDTDTDTEATPAAERQPLAVVHKSVRPHGRLGLAWAVVTVAGAIAGPTWLAGWMAVAAFVGGAQASVAWRKRGERSLTLVAAVVAGALPIAASFDVGAITATVVAGVLVAFVARLRAPSLAPSRDIALTLALGVPIGLAAASPVLVRQTGIAPTLLLLALVSVYDAGAYLVGTGAASAWEGPAAGVAALIPVTIFASVVLIPPFSGAEPLLLGVLAAVLAPAGPVAASALLGDRSAHAPALRRLDSLLLLGPLWAWFALVMLR